MSDGNVVIDEKAYNRNAIALRRIASALGQPESAFFEGSPKLTNLNDTCELLRIWADLESTVGREKVLTFMRSFVAQA